LVVRQRNMSHPLLGLLEAPLSAALCPLLPQGWLGKVNFPKTTPIAFNPTIAGNR
jgi:hypothetical protein